MLLLFARQDEATCAIDAARVVEILPSIVLKKPVGEPARVEGFFTYRGRVLRAVDLGRLVGEHPTRNLLSARLIVVDDPRVRVGEPALAILTQAIGDLTRVDDSLVAATPSGSSQAAPLANFLGPVVSIDDELVRIVYPERVLDA